MHADPVVSVITVTYNAAAAVEATLDSVCQQVFRDFEWLVIDGNSSDGTLSIVGEDRVADGVSIRSISERDEGLYDAMNKGIAQARGTYVIFMNAGDVFFDDRVLADFAAFVEARNDLPAMVYGHTLVRFTDGKTYNRFVRPLSYIRHGQPTMHQAVFFLRSAHLEHNYRFRTFPVSADYAAMCAIQIAFAGEIAVWDRFIATFDNDPNSFSNRRAKQQLIDSWRAQRDILAVPVLLRVRSAIKRFSVLMYFRYGALLRAVGFR